MKAKPYTRESLERALAHHGVEYSPPDPSLVKQWGIRTRAGRVYMNASEVYAFVLGLATKEARS